MGKEVCRIIHHRGSQQILFKVDQTRTRSCVPKVTIVAREETNRWLPLGLGRGGKGGFYILLYTLPIIFIFNQMYVSCK